MRHQSMSGESVNQEARDRINIVSILEEVRGTVEPKKQLLLDGMSAVLTHEQGALKLYNQYSKDTKHPEFQEKWQEFGEETQIHARVAERVISAMGGDPSYRSSVAKELEKTANTMLKIEAQGEDADLVRLGNLVMAENICKHHWQGVNTLARNIKDPATAKIFWDASRIVERDEDEHVTWNAAMFDSQLEKVTTGR